MAFLAFFEVGEDVERLSGGNVVFLGICFAVRVSGGRRSGSGVLARQGHRLGRHDGSARMWSGKMTRLLPRSILPCGKTAAMIGDPDSATLIAKRHLSTFPLDTGNDILIASLPR